MKRDYQIINSDELRNALHEKLYAWFWSGLETKISKKEFSGLIKSVFGVLDDAVDQSRERYESMRKNGKLKRRSDTSIKATPEIEMTSAGDPVTLRIKHKHSYRYQGGNSWMCECGRVTTGS